MTSSLQPLLQIGHLCVAYGQLQVIRDVTLEVGEGEIVALIGANGAGKTTILRTISGLLRPSAGTIRVLGAAFGRFSGTDLAHASPYRIVKMGISHVPERRGIFANLTVYENLLMGAYSRRIPSSDFDEVYALFPRLSERKAQIAGTLSGGEQQMLALGRALLAKPRLMLLDEPSLGLAPQITRQILETIKRINQSGTTVLLVEQNALAALKIASRAYVLEVGEITGSGTSQALLSDDSIRKAYLGES